MTESERSASLARLLDDAHLNGRLLAASAHACANLREAYEIQAELTARRLARGARMAGWKLGYTSIAMRLQMGIDGPNFGPLLDTMIVPSGTDVAGRAAQPKVEPELALRFGREVKPGATRDDVLAAVTSVHACLEVVDSVWEGYRFTLPQNTADGSSACAAVIGPELTDAPALPEVSVVLLHNQREVARAHGAAASGHPADGVVWLVEQLARRGLSIEAGSVVITGGLTPAITLGPGDTVSAVFDGSTTVTVTRS